MPSAALHSLFWLDQGEPPPPPTGFRKIITIRRTERRLDTRGFLGWWDVRKPLLLHSTGICQGPLVAVDGPCIVETRGFANGDKVAIFLIADLGTGEGELLAVIESNDSELHHLGSVRGWLRAVRLKSSGQPLDVMANASIAKDA